MDNKCILSFLIFLIALARVHGQCVGNTGLAPDGTCLVCVINNCENCASNYNLCQSCKKGYMFQNGNCISCPANCETCSSSTKCTKCRFPSYTLVGDSCARCTHPQCTQCLSPDNCYYCGFIGQRYGIDSEKSCSTCEQTLCKACYGNNKGCIECSTGYGPNTHVDSAICVPCSSEKCVECASFFETCTLCTTGFGINEQKECLECLGGHCLDCGKDYSHCEECEDGYGLNVDGTCQKCKEECLECSKTNFESCINCNVGDYLSTGKCLKCSTEIDLCLECTNEISCTKCENTSYVHGGNCENCSIALVACLFCSNKTHCLECEEGYYLDANVNQCQKCPESCVSCYWDVGSKDFECDLCSEGYFLTEGRVKRCGLKCGEKVLEELECYYDENMEGCSKDCTIEQNFTCKIQGTEKVPSLCSYSSEIELKVIKTSRKKLSNTLELTIELNPPLKIFSTAPIASSMTLSPAFPFTCTFTAPSTLSFEIEIPETLTQTQISLSLSPSPLPPLWATPASSTEIQVEEFVVYGGMELGGAQIIYGGCIAIGVVGWVNVVLGFFAKKLLPIELFMVYEIFFQQFVWMKIPMYEPLTSIAPLENLMLYNKKNLIHRSHLLQQSSLHVYKDEISREAPHFYLSKEIPFSFLNNFNFSVLFQFIPLIVFCISSLILRRYTNRIKEIVGECAEIMMFNDKEGETEYSQLKKKITITEKITEISSQTFLCLTTLNIPHYSNTLYLSLLSLHPHPPISHLLPLILLSLPFPLAILLYFLYPDPLGYFRYSFHRSRMAMLQYFFVGGAFVSTIIVLFLCRVIWICFVPIGVLIGWTLLWRPYKEWRDNYRSIAVWSLGLIVLGVTIMANKEGEQRDIKGLCIYVIVGVAVMLVAGVGIGGWLGYRIFYVWWVLPRIEKSEKEKILIELDKVYVNQKIKNSNLENSIYKNLIRKEMTVLGFSHEMKNLALENRINETKKSREVSFYSFFLESPKHTFSHVDKESYINLKKERFELKKLCKEKSFEDIDNFHINFVSQLEKENEKVTENIITNFEHYVKNKEEEENVIDEGESEGADKEEKKSKEKTTYALEVVAEENNYLRVKNAEQYTKSNRIQNKDDEKFLEEYEKIENVTFKTLGNEERSEIKEIFLEKDDRKEKFNEN